MKRLLRILSAVMIIAILACVCVACDKDTPTDKTNPNGGATENGGNGTSGGTTDEETTNPSVSGKTYKYEKAVLKLTDEQWNIIFQKRMDMNQAVDDKAPDVFFENDVLNDDFKARCNKVYTEVLYWEVYEAIAMEFCEDGKIITYYNDIQTDGCGLWEQNGNIVKMKGQNGEDLEDSIFLEIVNDKEVKFIYPHMNMNGADETVEIYFVTVE